MEKGIPKETRIREPSPSDLTAGGVPRFGIFSSPPSQVDLMRVARPWDTPLGFTLPRALQNFRLKEWQAFQAVDENRIILVALYNSKLFALGQFLIYDRETGLHRFYKRIAPPFAIKVARGLHDTTSHFSFGGLSLKVHNRADRGTFFIDATCRGTHDLEPLKASLTGKVFADNALVVSLPFAARRGMYSQKQLLSLSGSVLFGNESMEFAPDRSFMIMDDHKGYYPWKMRYDWVTAAGYDHLGRAVGCNLTHNQALEPQKFNENCLWLEGGCHLLPPVHFERPHGVEGEWHITDEHGLVDLRFMPLCENTLKLNLGLVVSRYFGPFGSLQGTIHTESGVSATFASFMGMGEQKYVRA